MKIDTSIVNKGLTEAQEFFLGCWYNMCHEQSLDSDRVSIIVPHNGIIELINLFSFGSNYGGDDKRVEVATELHSILKKDLVLKLEGFSDTNDELVALLDPDKNSPADRGPINKQQALTSSIAKQLLDQIDTSYIESAFNLLTDVISEPITDQSRHQSFLNIVNLTNSIIGTLISKGHGLQEIISFYRNILIRHVNQNSFPDGLEFLKQVSLQEKEEFTVKYKVGNSALAELIYESTDDIKFGNFTITFINNSTCEAKITLEASSHRIAGLKGFDQLGELIDAISYTLGRDTITIEKKYIVAPLSNPANSKQFQNRKSVPNPNYEFDKTNFSNFLSSLDGKNNNSNCGFNNKKISSAFRHYRIGNFSTSIETKFISFWTALESITRDTFPNAKGDDNRVILATVPCISSDYVCKKLTAFLTTLHKLQKLDFTVDEEAVCLRGIPNNIFYNHLKNESFTSVLLAEISDYPFFVFKLTVFIKLCRNPEDMGLVIDAHESRVTRQLKRIYRARNIIVHNADKVESLELLCANLEHYLKTCLNSMVDLMTVVPTITTPEECFIRYKHIITKTKIELNPILKKSAGPDRVRLYNKGGHTYNDDKLIQLITMH